MRPAPLRATAAAAAAPRDENCGWWHARAHVVRANYFRASGCPGTVNSSFCALQSLHHALHALSALSAHTARTARYAGQWRLHSAHGASVAVPWPCQRARAFPIGPPPPLLPRARLRYALPPRRALRCAAAPAALRRWCCCAAAAAARVAAAALRAPRRVLLCPLPRPLPLLLLRAPRCVTFCRRAAPCASRAATITRLSPPPCCCVRRPRRTTVWLAAPNCACPCTRRCAARRVTTSGSAGTAGAAAVALRCATRRCL